MALHAQISSFVERELMSQPKQPRLCRKHPHQEVLKKYNFLAAHLIDPSLEQNLA